MTLVVGEVRHVIDGELEASDDGKTFETRDPHDGALTAQVAEGGAPEAKRAISAARRAFDEGPWPRLSTGERRRLLHAFADQVDGHAEELALLDVRDMGKPIREARAMDIRGPTHGG